MCLFSVEHITFCDIEAHTQIKHSEINHLKIINCTVFWSQRALYQQIILYTYSQKKHLPSKNGLLYNYTSVINVYYHGIHNRRVTHNMNTAYLVFNTTFYNLSVIVSIIKTFHVQIIYITIFVNHLIHGVPISRSNSNTRQYKPPKIYHLAWMKPLFIQMNSVRKLEALRI